MSGIDERLEIGRQALLDLSTRNRLLSVPQKSRHAKLVEVVDELTSEIFRLLVKEGKALSFLPGKETKKKTTVKGEEGSLSLLPQDKEEKEDDYFAELPQPDENEEVDERGIAKRHSDHRLQTLLTSQGLQNRLLSLYYDAITFEQEQGVNILYLSLGMLKWFEADNSDVERYAPLVLVPVMLERGTAAERFKIKWRNEEPAANLSLQAKMKAEFGLALPDLPDDDDIDISIYMEEVRKAVSGQERFEVHEDKMVLGFFSFAKFLMYRDLDPENWPEHGKLDQHQLVAGLMQDGFPAAEDMIGEDAYIDEYLPPERMFHVVDADSSQTLAIEEVRRGQNLVIQGPPGTGKSQTITNIIASAVSDGKKVLFVAEKMAALEVVHRRMDNIALGPLCLELHSSKSNKRAVLEELKKTRDLGRPQNHDGAAALAKLRLLREKLNVYAGLLHKPYPPSGLTPYNIIGNMVRLKQDGFDARGIVLDKPESWSAQQKKDKETLLADVVARIRETGTPSDNIWCGVNRPQFLPNEFERFEDMLVALKKHIALLSKQCAQVESVFSIADATLNSYNFVREIVGKVAAMPPADRAVLSHAVWRDDPGLIGEIVENGTRYSGLAEKLSGKVVDAAWASDLAHCRQQIAMHGESLLRIFHSEYRQSISLLKSLLTTPLPQEHDARLQIVDDIMSVQRTEKFLREKDQAGKDVFGSMWQGLRSDWSSLDTLLQWRNGLDMDRLPPGFLASCTNISAPEDWRTLSGQPLETVPALFKKVTDLFEVLHMDISTSFGGAKTTEEIDRADFEGRLVQWTEQAESISRWINFKTRFDKLSGEGMSAIADKLWLGDVSPEESQGVFEKAYFDAMSEAVFTEHPELRNFDGEEHSLNVVNFRENVDYRIEQARVELREKHFSAMPRSEGGIGPLGVLNGEFAKKRNHLSIRQLIKRAGPAIQALKPVFMMSPLSVAQFLEPGSIQFDLLVIDEASQVEPVDALGAIARCQQIVVVGDTRQLPPTRFFSRVTGNTPDEDDEGDDDTVATQDVESILSLCLARGLPQRMLRWHYRSKHQSLIAVSNKQFYENKLFIVPSPYDAASGMGLKFNYLPEGIFDSGGTATNVVEAKAVAAAVIKHAQDKPGLSLGVGTFSLKQKQAIIDELELLRRQHPETENFFSGAHADEPFFVKNLENIQGDERDVIFISVGYGKNKNGYMAMRFGPVSSEGGERRLNVLISRAKQRCEIFSSITADDIDLERGRKAGVAALKMFLKFAQTGKLDYGKLTEREPDSIFEEQVAAALRSYGFDVKTQVGIAGFFVDIAVVDPGRPGRFLLGIECDGASYHSSRSARDRDRLRQAVLEAHGWIIHRIWSTDWFRRPNEQLEKTLQAIEAAKEDLAARDEDGDINIKRKAVFEISDEAVTVSIAEELLSVPYREASMPVSADKAPHEISDSEMAVIVTKIVEVEAPVHEEEIVTRVRTLWNLARAGRRIHAKVEAALGLAKRKGMVTQSGNFYSTTGAEILVRDRSDVSSLGLRKPEFIAPEEFRKAILAVIEANFGAEREHVSSEVSSLLGFKLTSAQLRELIEAEINKLLSEAVVADVDGLLKIKSEAIEAKA